VRREPPLPGGPPQGARGTVSQLGEAIPLAPCGKSRGGGTSDAPEIACPRCRKPPGLCVCDAIEPTANRVFVLILQHPQEQDRELGSAWLAHLQFVNSRLVVGLSWRGLAAVLGRPADPRKWGVLYLGPVKAAADGSRPPLAAVSGARRALAGSGGGAGRARRPSFCSTATGARRRRCGGATRGS